MFEKVAILGIGIILILMGLQTFFMGGFRMWERVMSYGSVHSVIGIIFMIGGLYFVYKETRMIIRDRKKGRPPREGD
jgi:ABC-type enterochelin transport system permease subunit